MWTKKFISKTAFPHLKSYQYSLTPSIKAENHLQLHTLEETELSKWLLWAWIPPSPFYSFPCLASLAWPLMQLPQFTSMRYVQTPLSAPIASTNPISTPSSLHSPPTPHTTLNSTIPPVAKTPLILSTASSSVAAMSLLNSAKNV